MQIDDHVKYFLETFGLTEENAEEYANNIRSYFAYRGLMKRTTDFKYIPIQFCLTPTQVPEHLFKRVQSIQRVMNRLVHNVANSQSYLSTCFECGEYLDDFNTRLWEIQKRVLNEGTAHQPEICILRCDYMLHQDELTGDLEIKLVEYNTMAVAMGSLASIVYDLHEYMFDRMGKSCNIEKIPKNNSAEGVAMALVEGFKYYQQYESENGVILFVVESHELSNICDHRALQFDCWKRHKKIHVIMHTFKELQSRIHVKNNKLFVGELEVAVVYYRWGYLPEHYEEKDWEVRYQIERSSAIKIPTIAYQLAGTKRVQQMLSCGSLHSFIESEDDRQTVDKLFVKHHVLELNDKGSKSVALALNNPEKYVLKPDREGGGHNIFGEDIVQFINSYKKKDSNELYILMEKINSPKCPNYVARDKGPPKLTDVVVEIGIFGTAIAAHNSWKSAEIGYIVKTKEYGTNEGGLCSGLSYIDAPFFC